MIRPAAILFTCLLAFLSACGPSSSDAAGYNDQLIEEQNKVANKGESFFAAMDVSPEEMKKAFDAFTEQVNLSLKISKEIGPFDKDSAFQSACVRALELQEGFCKTEYKTIVELLSKPDDQISEEDTELYTQLIGEIDAKQKKAMMELHAAQSEFAKTWNFMIDPTKTFE